MTMGENDATSLHGSSKEGAVARRRACPWPKLDLKAVDQTVVRSALSAMTLKNGSGQGIAAGRSATVVECWDPVHERGIALPLRRKAERPWLRSATDVPVVEFADLRHCHDIAALGWLDSAWLGRVFP